MSQISYEEYESRKQAAAANQNSGPRINFFSLRNNNDEAVVRFMHDSPADFDIVAVHPMQVGGKFKKINCLRDPHDPISACPLCEAGKSLQKKIYIRLIEYKRDETGAIQAFPRVWERSTEYISKLKNLCDEYQPLSEQVFKIKRNGEAGSVDTTYDILFANPNVYRSDIYPKDATLFENYKVIGSTVLFRSAEKMNEMLNGTESEVKPKPASTYSPNANTAPATYQPAASVAEPVAPRSYIPETPVAGVNTPDSELIRPRRLY